MGKVRTPPHPSSMSLFLSRKTLLFLSSLVLTLILTLPATLPPTHPITLPPPSSQACTCAYNDIGNGQTLDSFDWQQDPTDTLIPEADEKGSWVWCPNRATPTAAPTDEPKEPTEPSEESTPEPAMDPTEMPTEAMRTRPARPRAKAGGQFVWCGRGDVCICRKHNKVARGGGSSGGTFLMTEEYRSMYADEASIYASAGAATAVRSMTNMAAVSRATGRTFAHPGEKMVPRGYVVSSPRRLRFKKMFKKIGKIAKVVKKFAPLGMLVCKKCAAAMKVTPDPNLIRTLP